MVSFGYVLPTRGVVVQSTDRTELTARTASSVVDLAGRAESLGYESAWVGDSVLAKPRLEPLTTLAAVATTTDAIDLGTAVYLPALRHPIHIAHMTATVDQLSGGRLTLGVGVGVRPAERREMEQLNVDYENRGVILNESLDIITQLWTGTSVTYDGGFHTIDDANLGFTPAADPSIYVASAAFNPESGFPSTVRERLQAHGDGWLPIAMEPDRYRAGLENIRGFLADADTGFVPGYYIDVVVGSSETEALTEAHTFLQQYYADEQLGYTENDSISEEIIRERGVFGPPARVANRLETYMDAGVEQFIVRFTARDQFTQLRRFSDIIDSL